MLADEPDSVHAEDVASHEEERLSLRVEAEETPTSGHLRLMDRAGNEVGHMRFRREGKKLIVIVHTEVDSSLRGQQGGRRSSSVVFKEPLIRNVTSPRSGGQMNCVTRL